MPIYEFNCGACSKSFESLMRPYDPIECAHCKTRDQCERVVTAAAHVWKPGTEVESPKKPWAGKPHREG